MKALYRKGRAAIRRLSAPERLFLAQKESLKKQEEKQIILTKRQERKKLYALAHPDLILPEQIPLPYLRPDEFKIQISSDIPTPFYQRHAFYPFTQTAPLVRAAAMLLKVGQSVYFPPSFGRAFSFSRHLFIVSVTRKKEGKDERWWLVKDLPEGGFRVWRRL